MLSYLLGCVCSTVATYNIGIFICLSSISIDSMSLLSAYFKPKKKL